METQTEDIVLTLTAATRTETTTPSNTPTNKRHAEQQANQNIQTNKCADDQGNAQKHPNSSDSGNKGKTLRNQREIRKRHSNTQRIHGCYESGQRNQHETSKDDSENKPKNK